MNYELFCNFAHMMTENPYIKQFPDLMAGKTVLYVHGFASSGQSGTVTRLRTVMPQARVVAPDLPIHPQEAVDLLHHICDTEHPDLIIGTSMGGMYTEQLRGFDRICVNPALEMGETMRAHGMTGTQQFQNPRLDGIQEFYVDKALIKEYRDVSEQRFQGLTPDDERRVYGVFGDKDDVVDTFGMFSDHYTQATHFHGEHRMDDKSFMHSVLPVIRWIDDRQEGRQRPIIYIGIESLSPCPLQNGTEPKPLPSCQKAIRLLIEHYQVYFVAEEETMTQAWLTEHIGIPAWRHLIVTWRRDLLYGDYLIMKKEEKGGDNMLATVLEYGSDTFKTWDAVIGYFEKLGGQ